MAETTVDDHVAASGRSVEMRVAATVENLAVVRTLVAAVATFEDLDLDVVADLRLAVDEACTRLVQSAAAGSTLLLVVEPSEEAVVICASTTCEAGEDIDTAVVAPGSFSWHVLSSLTDDVRTFSDGYGTDGRRIQGISLTARRVSLSR